MVDSFAKDCHSFGGVRECLAPGWKEATARLSEVNPVKMPIRVVIDGPPMFTGYGNVTVVSANKCWEEYVRLPASAPTKRVRFYGMDKYQKPPGQLHGWPPSASRDGGYFAYELIK